jgi:hypothetical protein
MTLSITFTLTGDDLVIASDSTSGLWLDDVDIVIPSFGVRTRGAAVSDVLPGSTLLAWTEEIDELQFSVYAGGDDQAELAANMAAFESAMKSLAPIVVTEHGVATTYSDRWPAAPQWDGVRSGIHDIFIRRAVCVVPVNPI